MPALAARNRIEITVGGPLKGRRSQVILRAIERGLLAGGREALETTKRLTPVFRGDLIRSYQIQFRRAPRGVLITNFSGHARFMEEGRAPGRWPPEAPIRRWVEIKLPALVRKWGLRGATFLIRRAIGTKGIRVARSGDRGLRHDPAKGAMFRRTLLRLGSSFFSERIAREVLLVQGLVR